MKNTNIIKKDKSYDINAITHHHTFYYIYYIFMPAEKKYIPASFENKLLRMLVPEYKNIICWNQEGDGFIILDLNNFINKMLPLFFKTSKFASFVRQLNFYGFSKYTSATLNPGIYGYRNPLFQRYSSAKNIIPLKKETRNWNEIENNIILIMNENEKLKKFLTEKEDEITALKHRCSELERFMVKEEEKMVEFNSYPFELYSFDDNFALETLPEA